MFVETYMREFPDFNSDGWWPLELSQQETASVGGFITRLSTENTRLDTGLLRFMDVYLAHTLKHDIEYLLAKDSLPILGHILNGWGNAVFNGRNICEYLNGFLHRDEKSNYFLLQRDPEGDFHPWQSLAYAIMAGVDPEAPLSSGVTLRQIADNSRYINVSKGVELGHLLFTVAYLHPRLGGEFLLKGEAYDLPQLIQMACRDHYYGDFEVCRKFHLTEGLCAAVSRIEGFSEYRPEVADFLRGQLNMLLLIGVILSEASEALRAGEGIGENSAAAHLRNTLHLGPMLENHCFYAGHIIELASFSALLGYEIGRRHKRAIAFVINKLNEILLAYLPLVDFRESFLHFGHYRRAITLWGEIASGNFRQIVDLRGALSKYAVKFDSIEEAWDELKGEYTATGEPRDSIFKVAKLQSTVREFFNEVITLYDLSASDTFKSQGRGDHYRRIRPQWWPRSIHYELFDYDNSVGAEIHLESAAVAPVREALIELIDRHKDAFTPGSVDWDHDWYNGTGRLRVLFDEDEAPDIVAGGMSKLIHLTFEKIDHVVRDLRPTPREYLSLV